MGFDLYGLKPKINKEHPDRYTEIMNEYGKDGYLDWSKDIPEVTKKEYFELVQQHELDNPGHYFRNNVWWWRPLWHFVCATCDDILTEKDMAGGSYNDGHKISKTKAIRIAKRISKLIADGTVDELDKREALNRAKAKAHNELVQEELDKIKETVVKALGDENIAPVDYPKPYKDKWDEVYARKKWASDYPFDKENVEDFAKFCLDSGGFEIC